MENIFTINDIPIFNDKNILNQETLSNSFGTYCKKITFEDGQQIVIKGLENINIHKYLA